MPQVKSVTVMVGVRAGGRYETKETNGIAHFAEHMFFKGTQKRPRPRDLAVEVDGVGGEFNASTGNEATVFYVKSAVKHLGLGLDILSDMLQNSKFDSGDIDREKGVVTEEINMYQDTPRDYISEVYQRLLYGDHPLGWDILGTKTTVSSLKRSDFLDYLDKWFYARNMVLCVVGKVDPQKVFKQASDCFGKVEKTSLGREFLSAVDSQDSPQVLLHPKKTDQAHLALGVRTFKRDHPQRYVLEVLNTILGQGMSSRLFTSVREKEGLAYYVYSGAEGFWDVGSLVAWAGVDTKRIKKAVRVILKEFANLRSQKVSPQELQKAKEYIKGRLTLALEGTGGVTTFLTGQAILEKQILTPEEIAKKIDAVSAADVQEVAQQIFKNEGLNLAIIGPYRGKEEFEEILSLG
ncbi:insulinase family protein [Candidatus Parcubacteria bacterium]|nr:insulinase family protein [Candidatus Parcubacteria bacterium]